MRTKTCSVILFSKTPSIRGLWLPYWNSIKHSQLILLPLRSRITIHALTAARQQSYGNSQDCLSQICGEWRDVFKRTLSPIQGVPVQNQRSKIPFVKFGAIKIILIDRVHQQYLTINFGIWQQLQLPLVRLCEHCYTLVGPLFNSVVGPLWDHYGNLVVQLLDSYLTSIALLLYPRWTLMCSLINPCVLLLDPC